MAIFLKNFMAMTEEEISKCYIKFGTPEVTKRSFIDIVGREMRDTKEEKLLREILDDIYDDDCGLDAPFDLLLSLEYGPHVLKVNALPEEVLSYLLNTPYEVIRMDHQHALSIIREIYETRSQKAS